MANTTKKWKLEFEEVQGGDPDLALKKHFLGADIHRGINLIGSCTLSFVLPESGSGILSDGGLPPMKVTVRDANDHTLFHGTAADLRSNQEVRGLELSIVYYDPLYWELNDEASHAYKSGTLREVLNQLASDSSLTIQYGDVSNLHLSSRRVAQQSRLATMIEAASEVGAYLLYDPHQNTLLVKPWKLDAPQEIGSDVSLLPSIAEFNGAAAMQELNLQGRKELKNDWFSVDLPADHVTASRQLTKSRARSWLSANSARRKAQRWISSRNQSEAQQLGDEIMGAQLMQADRLHLTMVGASLLPGECFTLPKAIDPHEADLLVLEAHDTYRSAIPESYLIGVRA